MAVLIPLYTGIVPNRQTDTKEAFAQNVYDMFTWTSDSFASSFNTAVTSVNDDITTVTNLKDTTLKYKNDTQLLKDDVIVMRDIVLDASNYMGDYDSTTTYPRGASVSFTDGYIYYSKHDNNTTSPTTATSTSDWYFAGRRNFSYTTQTANYTAVNMDFVYCDTSAGSFTVTLPALPSANDKVAIMDITTGFSTNPLTVGANGNTIMGLAEDMLVDTDNISFELIYVNNDWRIL